MCVCVIQHSLHICSSATSNTLAEDCMNCKIIPRSDSVIDRRGSPSVISLRRALRASDHLPNKTETSWKADGDRRRSVKTELSLSLYIYIYIYIYIRILVSSCYGDKRGGKPAHSLFERLKTAQKAFQCPFATTKKSSGRAAEKPEEAHINQYTPTSPFYHL